MNNFHEWNDDEEAFLEATSAAAIPNIELPTTEIVEVSEEKSEVDRLEQANKVVTFLEKINAKEVFSTEERRADFVKNLSVEEAKDFLVHLNGIILDTPATERKLVSDNNVVIRNFDGKIDYIPPFSGLKEELMEMVFDESKKIEGPKEVGLLYSAEIQALHLFDDGNGRLARLVYLLFSKDHIFDEEDKKDIVNAMVSRIEARVKPYVAFLESHTSQLLAEKAGVDLEDPELPLALLNRGTFEELVEVIQKNQNLNENDKAILEDILEDSAYAILTCINFFRKSDKDFSDCIASNPESEEFHGKGIVLEDLMPLLDHDDVSEMSEQYQTLKYIYVKLLADIIVNPDAYPCDFKGTKNLKEMYIACVEKYGYVEGQESHHESQHES